MFDFFSEQAMNILSMSVCGISVGSILALAIYVIVQIRKNRGEIKVTSEQISKSFKDVILPKNIKLDISSKIEKPIKEAFANFAISFDTRLKHMERGEQLLLNIVSLFSHVNQLPEELQEEIKEYLEDAPTEIKL